MEYQLVIPARTIIIENKQIGYIPHKQAQRPYENSAKSKANPGLNLPML